MDLDSRTGIAGIEPGCPVQARQAERESEFSPYLLFGGRIVRAVISQRAGGLLIVINMNPDGDCNFDCRYCEVSRSAPASRRQMDVKLMSSELKWMLELAQPAQVHEVPAFARMPPDLMHLRGVALSGDGEPTLCPKFLEVVREVVRVRNLGVVPWFKLILVTNTTGLKRKTVRSALKLFNDNDQVWLKLDAGTQAYFKTVNRSRVQLRSVLANIRDLARRRPVVIQSMFCEIDGHRPSDQEISEYLERLKELKAAGCHMELIQIYSTSRRPALASCKHLPLFRLSQIARQVREETGLKTEVF